VRLPILMKACGGDAGRISQVLVLRRGSLLHSLGQETVAGDPVVLKPQSDLVTIFHWDCANLVSTHSERETRSSPPSQTVAAITTVQVNSALGEMYCFNRGARSTSCDGVMPDDL